MDIGNKIKILREEKHMSQQKLADLISKSKSTIEKYEDGRIEVSVRILKEISKALNINILRFVADEEDLLNNVKQYYQLKDNPNYNMEDDFKLILEGFINRYK